MLFEPYTGAGTLKCLDAECNLPCGPLASFWAASIRKRVGGVWILALCGWVLLVPASLARAQSPQTGSVSGTSHPALSSAKNQSSTAAKSKAHDRTHHTRRHRRRVKPEAAVVAPTPPPPAAPADQPAKPATVDFSQGLLSIQAQNSSLVAILDQVSHQTGLHVEGLSHDERVYGQYGPGDISTTLSALLDGSGYDYVIIGGVDHGPAQLVLSTGGGAASSPPAAASTQQPASETSNSSTPADPTSPVQPKTPQEIFNELRRMHPR